MAVWKHVSKKDPKIIPSTDSERRFSIASHEKRKGGYVGYCMMIKIVKCYSSVAL